MSDDLLVAWHRELAKRKFVIESFTWDSGDAERAAGLRETRLRYGAWKIMLSGRVVEVYPRAVSHVVMYEAARRHSNKHTLICGNNFSHNVEGDAAGIPIILDAIIAQVVGADADASDRRATVTARNGRPNRKSRLPDEAHRTPQQPERRHGARRTRATRQATKRRA